MSVVFVAASAVAAASQDRRGGPPMRVLPGFKPRKRPAARVKAAARRAARFARTAVKAAKFLFTVRAALPKWVAALVVFGLLPIPGPVDEVAVVVAAAVLWFRHRPLLRVVWRAAQMEAEAR